ncbi:MAG: hypothetical protein ACTTI6_06130, partial [Treponema sp.]|uniref:hypothetical protein n=1 Tax=Treponema sp. TaxID=166 RepID=UPI003FA20557
IRRYHKNSFLGQYLLQFMLCRTGLIFPLTNRLANSILKNIMVVGLEIMKSANFIEYPPHSV